MNQELYALQDEYMNGFAMVQALETYLCGYLNEAGEEVIPCQYQYALNFSENGFALVKNNDLWGVIDKAGKEVLPCAYTYISHYPNSPVYILQQVEVHEGNETCLSGAYHSQTRQVLAPQYADLSPIFKTEWLLATDYAGKKGVVDIVGKIIVPYLYDGVSYEHSWKTFLVRQGDLWGALNEQGAEILPCMFDINYALAFLQ